MTENFPNFVKEKGIQVLKLQGVLKQENTDIDQDTL